MGRFDIEPLRRMKSEDFRVMFAVEAGAKNHEVVPLKLICKLCGIYGGATYHILRELAKSNLVTYINDHKSNGYHLTVLGYDYLALYALRSRQVVASVGNQIGVGKEADVYVGGDAESEDLVLKFHRLGRTSFRKLKEKRDYHSRRHHCSWANLSKVSAAKEFKFLKALFKRNFPVPKPLDVSRHAVVMSLITGVPLVNVNKVDDPAELYSQLMSLIVRLAKYGLIHGDFNEFNLMLTEEGEVVLIDFPQMVSIDHPNAGQYFDRDVECIREFFRRRFGFESEEFPVLEEIRRKHFLDVKLEASGYKRKTGTVITAGPADEADSTDKAGPSDEAGSADEDDSPDESDSPDEGDSTDEDGSAHEANSTDEGDSTGEANPTAKVNPP